MLSNYSGRPILVWGLWSLTFHTWTSVGEDTPFTQYLSENAPERNRLEKRKERKREDNKTIGKEGKRKTQEKQEQEKP